MTADDDRSHQSLAERAKAAVPRPVKDALKPIVRTIVHLREEKLPRRSYAAADNWTGNRWTIDDHGRLYKFFFICGCYKSGTHWVQHILNLHPAVNVTGEFHFEALWKGFNQLVSVPWYLSAKPPVSDVAADTVQDLVRRTMYTQLRDKPAAVWLGDRTPRPLGEFLPGAPTIAIRRDGRDVMVSWNFHHLRVKDPTRFLEQFQPQAMKLIPEFQADPSAFEKKGKGFLVDEEWFRFHAKLWASTVLTEMQEAKRFRERGTPLLEIGYERMWHDVQSHADRLYRFLDLDPAEAEPLSRENKTLPGFENSAPNKFLRKGVIGEWKEYFDERQIRWFKQEAGEVLIAAGYEKDMQW